MSLFLEHAAVIGAQVDKATCGPGTEATAGSILSGEPLGEATCKLSMRGDNEPAGEDPRQKDPPRPQQVSAQKEGTEARSLPRAGRGGPRRPGTEFGFTLSIKGSRGWAFNRQPRSSHLFLEFSSWGPL